MIKRILILLAIVAVPCTLPAAPPQPNGATISGRVIYHPDAKRRWRYGRFYIRDEDKGELAEAVVALRIPRSKKPAAPAQAKTHKVDQISFQFTPETTALRLGDRIRFTNSDASLHNIRTQDGQKPFNINLGTDEEHFHTPIRAGGIRKPLKIGCAFHGGMRAWIFVFDHPWFQVTPENGQFQFENVPPGEYDLEMKHPAGNLYWKSRITVSTKDNKPIEIHVSPDNLEEAR